MGRRPRSMGAAETSHRLRVYQSRRGRRSVAHRASDARRLSTGGHPLDRGAMMIRSVPRAPCWACCCVRLGKAEGCHPRRRPHRHLRRCQLSRPPRPLAVGQRRWRRLQVRGSASSASSPHPRKTTLLAVRPSRPRVRSLSTDHVGWEMSLRHGPGGFELAPLIDHECRPPPPVACGVACGKPASPPWCASARLAHRHPSDRSGPDRP